MMAEGCRMVGRKCTADAYEVVAAEMEAGRLQPLETIEVDGAEVLAANRREAASNARQATRQRKLVGVLPEFQWRGGAAVVDQIAAAQFVGAKTTSFRRSVRRLVAARPQEVGRTMFETTREVAAGRRNASVQKVPAMLLTAEALEMIAENFDASWNQTGRDRAGALRRLARLMREAEAPAAA